MRCFAVRGAWRGPFGMHAHTCIRTCTHVHACMRTIICTDAGMHGCTDARMHGCTGARMHGHTYAPMYAPMRPCTHPPTHAPMRPCTYAPMHPCTHATGTRRCSVQLVVQQRAGAVPSVARMATNPTAREPIAASPRSGVRFALSSAFLFSKKQKRKTSYTQTG